MAGMQDGGGHLTASEPRHPHASAPHSSHSLALSEHAEDAPASLEQHEELLRQLEASATLSLTGSVTEDPEGREEAGVEPRAPEDTPEDGFVRVSPTADALPPDGSAPLAMSGNTEGKGGGAACQERAWTAEQGDSSGTPCMRQRCTRDVFAAAPSDKRPERAARWQQPHRRAPCPRSRWQKYLALAAWVGGTAALCAALLLAPLTQLPRAPQPHALAPTHPRGAPGGTATPAPPLEGRQCHACDSSCLLRQCDTIAVSPLAAKVHTEAADNDALDAAVQGASAAFVAAGDALVAEAGAAARADGTLAGAMHDMRQLLLSLRGALSVP
jgi:hypothetical protein